MRLLLISTVLSLLLTNCPTKGETQMVDMKATVNPKEAGSVNPPEGTYFAGKVITVEAIASDERWQFTGWSGDTTASGDSLTFKIRRDMNLVANYEILSVEKEFTNQITVSDGVNSMDLFFGMHENATSGFDAGIDRDLPPPPPSGSFYAQFNIPDYRLAEDYRAVRDQETIWELVFAPASGNLVSLSWDFSQTLQVGMLTLTDDPENPTFEIDMKSESSYQVDDQQLQKLYIVSRN